MKWWRRGTAGLVAGLVLAALSVGVVSPATAAGPLPLLQPDGCGASVSSVTACPANVLMLADAGILSLPATGGAVGAVATSGSGGAGVIEGLGVVGGLGFGLTQLFTPGGAFSGPAGLMSDGLHDLKVSVPIDTTFGASGGWSSPVVTTTTGHTVQLAGRSTIGKVGSASTWAATRYVYTPTNQFRDGSAKTTAGVVAAISGSNDWVSASCAGYDANGYAIADAPGEMCTRWKFSTQQVAAGSAAPDQIVAVAASSSGPWQPVTQTVNQVSTQAGTFKIHTWCADPVNPGGPLVDYMTAQIATLQAGQSVNLQNQVCPTGKAAADASISWEPGDGSATKTIVPPKGETAARAVPAVAANIANPGCAAGGCLLTLSKVNGDTCGSIGQLCPEWAKDPNYTQNYQCKFGGQVVSLDACSAYRSPNNGVLPNVTAGGTFLSPTAPVPTTFGTPVVNPVTGTAPAPGPSVEQGTDPQNCRPSSIWEVLNPFSLFTSVQCVLKDAFIPNQTKIQTSVQSVQTSWGNTPMGKVGTMVGSITAALPAGSGCSGIAFTFPSVLGVAAQNFHVLGACDPPVSGIATTVRIIGAIGMIIGGVLALTRIIGGVIALPGLGKSGGND